MAKHLKPHIKYKYIILYKCDISKEEIFKMMIESKHTVQTNFKGFMSTIKTWVEKVNEEGLEYLCSKSGDTEKIHWAVKKKKCIWNDLEKVALISIIEEYEKIINEDSNNKKKKVKVANTVINKFSMNVRKVLYLFDVSRSYHYKVIK